MGPECTSKHCDLCDQDIKPQGWTTHRKACETKVEKRRRDQVVIDAIHKEKGAPVSTLSFEYHPSSGIETKIHSFDTFQRRPAMSSVPLPDAQPWLPFKSRLEFEVAELALEVGLNNHQTDRLVKLCHRCAIGKEKFSFKNHKDIHSMWEAASHRITKFTKEVISVPYSGDNESREYEIHYHDLWELATDMLRNPQLFPHFTFDAHRFSKFDGNTFVPFVDEPFTAKDIWDVQSQLPPNAKPLAFILYADKTKLSSFGTAKGYPVVARLANLPTEIRNGQGAGSGYVVGWLPIVNDEKMHAGKPTWVNFKTAVWHKSFARILSSLASKSRTGQWFECLDGVTRWFFLCILILSADYEEHLWPCPVCLVSREELWDTSKSYRRWTSNESQGLVAAARVKETMEDREELLKEQALHDIDNTFWDVSYSDVHRALSHDRCHNNHGGFWSHHCWVELQKYLGTLGREKVSQVDKNFESFPCWWNHKHPNHVIGITFADSAVHEDISKVIIYATHNILTEHDCPLGYLLLRCICLYLKMDMYAAVEVHTTDTINAGRHTVQALAALMDQYITKTADENEKNWNFLKLHMMTHIFDDIEAKGASRNYNTKPNEQMHGPLKDSYLNQTNFKNIAEQILHIDHWLHVADDICCCISDFDDYMQSKSEDMDNDLSGDDEGATDSPGVISLDPSLHVKIGSKQAPQTFDFIENTHQGRWHIHQLPHQASEFLNNFLPACNIPLPGRRIRLQSDDTVTECRFLRVNYELLVDWRQYTDYLRCNPRFFNAPRFDCVFIRTKEKNILGHLVFLFECPVGNDLFPLALIHPFDAPTGMRLRKDKQLNLFRVRARPRAQAEFFSVRSIICGALLVQDGNSLDYLVVDTVNMDMFLRVQEMHLDAGHVVRA
ncbi:hypothetical protein DFH29DRAFT_985372 [Suillus ampliporus]|nr:hypothetical protein DFH29DRAFT_985372 [Suillus ampliporus]